MARPGAAQAPGSAAQQAARREQRDVYPKVIGKLAVLGFEVDGRMHAEAVVHPRPGGLEGMRCAHPSEKGCITAGQRPQIEKHTGGGGTARLRVSGVTHPACPDVLRRGQRVFIL